MIRLHRDRMVAVLLLITATVAVYGQTFYHEFIYYDDQIYVTDNGYVKRGLTDEGLVWAFTNTDVGHWHPLTWLSHMLDVELFGLAPGGHHISNVVIHVVNIILLLTLLVRMTGSFLCSFAVAILFALHPINVESVAWVAERKNVLSTAFWLGTMHCYIDYVKKRGSGRYITMTSLLALGLMAKPMLVSLPFILLLVDYWPLGRDLVGRWKTITMEKLPLVVLCLLSVFMTVYAAHSVGTIGTWGSYPLSTRIQNVLVSYVTYIRKVLWPSDLAVYYPYPQNFSFLPVASSALFLGAVTGVSIVLRRRFPFLIVGWLWFLVTMTPVIGIVQVGSQAMADRYAYVPMMGIFIVFAWSVPALVERVKLLWRPMSSWRQWLPGGFLLMMISLSLMADKQVGIWRNNFSLFGHSLRVTEDNQKAHHGMGLAWMAHGETALALYHLRESLRIRPDAGVYNDLGYVYMSVGKYTEAEEQFRAAVALDPRHIKAMNNLGVVYAAIGRYEDAAFLWEQVLAIAPRYETARYNLQKLRNDEGKSEGVATSPRGVTTE